MLVSFIEDEVKNSFGFYLALTKSFPNLEGDHLMHFHLIVTGRNLYQFLQTIIEVFLIVMKSRVKALFYFLLSF